MLNVERLENAAKALRTIAKNPTKRHSKELLALANDIDQAHKELPQSVHFITGVLSQYKPSSARG